MELHLSSCVRIFLEEVLKGGNLRTSTFLVLYLLGTAIYFQRREVPNFPHYARKIARRINRPIVKLDLATNAYHEILNAITVGEKFFRVAFFVDGSYFKCDTPGTGPHGHYKGAQRKPWAYITQRAVYSGHKKFHGIATLTIMMPNGINYMYGPFSARVGDRSAIHMSNMCQFLEQIHDGHFGGQHFAAYGDSAFTPMRPCMISRHGRQF
jgi:hypothetical protein